MRIATGEEEEVTPSASPAALARAVKGGDARAAKLEKTKRAEIAKKAAAARWAK
jgi:hypothetical protein